MESDRDSQRRQEIERKVIELAAEQGGVPAHEVVRETHFVNDLRYDSLETVELVIKLEDEFEMSIADEDVEKLHTVGQAIDYILDHLPSATPSA
jgi:acyl carrier protein